MMMMHIFTIYLQGASSNHLNYETSNYLISVVLICPVLYFFNLVSYDYHYTLQYMEKTCTMCIIGICLYCNLESLTLSFHRYFLYKIYLTQTYIKEVAKIYCFRRWLEVQKLRNRVKKNVDRKASKGRKIR